MNYIKPTYINAEPVEFSLSERTRKLIESYANYTGLTDKVYGWEDIFTSVEQINKQKSEGI